VEKENRRLEKELAALKATQAQESTSKKKDKKPKDTPSDSGISSLGSSRSKHKLFLSK